MCDRLVVAIQGEQGSYSEEATLLLLGPAVEVEYCEYFQEVFLATVEGRAGSCLVPIENSLTGSIHKNYDLLLRYGLKITREINLQIHHNLIASPNASFDEIETVISHPVALDQCERFFEQFTQLTRKSAYDTSGSVKHVMEGNLRNCAAIASERAADFYSAKILMAGIEDNKENFTRFVLLSPQLEIKQEADKTSVVFSFKNAPGALFNCLSVFAAQDIDLMKIESRPIHGRPWEYLFYLDFLGNTTEERTRVVLNQLEKITDFLEVLGCYPGAAR